MPLPALTVCLRFLLAIPYTVTVCLYSRHGRLAEVVSDCEGSCSRPGVVAFSGNCVACGAYLSVVLIRHCVIRAFLELDLALADGLHDLHGCDSGARV